MTVATEAPLHAGTETWEATGEQTVWVWVADPRARESGGYRKQRVGGSGGSKRLHISTDDRRYNEEQIVDENVDMNVFRNGALIRVDAGAKTADDVDARYHLTDKDLKELLSVREVEEFTEAVNDITSENIIRRLAALAETEGTGAQKEALKEIVEKRYKKGGTQRTVRELEAAEGILGGEQLS